MATVHVTWFGIVVEFSHLEITQITATLNTGAAGLGAVATALTAIGITGSAAVLRGAAYRSDKLALGSGAGCDRRGKSYHAERMMQFQSRPTPDYDAAVSALKKLDWESKTRAFAEASQPKLEADAVKAFGRSAKGALMAPNHRSETQRRRQ